MIFLTSNTGLGELVMLSWNKIEDRAVKFQMHWKNCDGNERQEGQSLAKAYTQAMGYVHSLKPDRKKNE